MFRAEPVSIFSQALKLESALYLVEVDPASGVIRRIFDKVGEVELIKEPRIAHSFQLLTLSTGMEKDWISGKDQSLSNFDQKDDTLRLRWGGPLTSEAGNWYEISVELEITFAESQIEFRLHVDNRTPRTVSQVWYPIVGGIDGIGDRVVTRSTLQETENRYDWYLASPIDASEGNADTVSQIMRTYAYDERNTPNCPSTA